MVNSNSKNKNFFKQNKFLILTVFSAMLLTSGFEIKNLATAGEDINVWWPVEGAKVRGVQPFKALLSGHDVSSYQMFWQVDDGQLNIMADNWTDYQHKESQVDLSSWNWRGSGPYLITFQAKDFSGQLLAKKSVSIFLDGAPATAPASTSVASQTLTYSSDLPIEVWWPVEGASISGTQPFKALVKNLSLQDYDLFWQVDGKELNATMDSWVDAPHKETYVNVSGWNWRGSGPYALNFVAKDKSGNVISQKTVNVSVPTSSTNTAISSITAITAPSTVLVSTTSVNPGNPLANETFYVDPYSNAARQAQLWSITRPADAQLMQMMARAPQARWLGDWNYNIYQDVSNTVSLAAQSKAMPVLVAYNIPFRDCGSYSSGGAAEAGGYRQWISDFVRGIGSRKAAVILEPDALSSVGCLNSEQLNLRMSLLSEAVTALKSNPGTRVYLDAGHAMWVSARDMAARLSKSGINRADGFALNVSNFITTSDNTRYGEEISRLVGGKHFVIDTGRNGLGPTPDYQWCNPPGRGLGIFPTTNTGHPLLDALLWIKTPGESDGQCNGGPSAGTWWPEYALDLARRAISR